MLSDLNTIYQIVSVGAILLTLAGTVMYAKMRAEKAEEIAASAKTKIDVVEKDLKDFQIHAARNFITSETLGRIEGRLEELGQEVRADMKDIKDTIIKALAQFIHR